MARGKHSSNESFDFEEIPWKKILLVIAIIVIFIGVLFGGKAVYSSFIANGKIFSKKIKETPKEENNVEEKMPTELYGYKVLGKIDIESKNYSSYILEAFDENEASKKENNSANNVNTENIVQNGETDSENENTENANENNEIDIKNNNSEKYEDALKKGLVKLYGDKLNQKGNFTIMGHNEKKYFSILNELEIGDEFSVKTTTNIEKHYKITSIETVEPTDLKALMPNKEYIELTLITCSLGSDQRLVVKALEETDYEILKSMNDNNSGEVDNQDKVEESNDNSAE